MSSNASKNSTSDEKEKPKRFDDYEPNNYSPSLQTDIYAIHNSLTAAQDSSTFDIPECRSRRLLELRLLQNFIEKTSATFSGCHNPDVSHTWSVEVPKLALKNDNLLYGMFSISALHLLKSQPEDTDLLLAREAYLGLSLREHRRAVAKLDSKSADAICFTSSLILIDSFASLQDRSLEPYSPPMEWLQMARGALSVFSIAMNAINNFDTAKITVVANAQPYLYDKDAMFAEGNREELLDLLRGNRPGEIWDAETRETYEQTLSYIGSIQLAAKAGEHRMGIARRMMAFAILIPKKFIEFVEQQRPRALVVLAHFFALSSDMEDVWWIGRAARSEIEAIQKFLPLEWQAMVFNPMQSIS